MINFTIPLPPVTKKNSQQILINKSTGKKFVSPSDKYKQYEREAGYFLQQRGKLINTAVNVKCLFYMPTRRKCDLTNLLEAIDDILVKYGVLADDNYTIIESHDGSRVFYDKDNPRTEVYIEPVFLHKPLNIKMTRYEKIKNMSIEEMTDLLEKFSACSRCSKMGNSCFAAHDIEQWLKGDDEPYV